MSERKLIIEVGIDDDAVNSIEDLEREILAQDICGQAARKYLIRHQLSPPFAPETVSVDMRIKRMA